MGSWFPGGFLGTHLHLFFLGAVGFALFRSLGESPRVVVGNILVLSAVGLAISPVFISKWPLIPYVIWFYVMGMTLLSRNKSSKLILVGEWFLNLSVCRFLGKISYSLYLWHWPILLALQYFVLKSFDIETRGQMVLILGALSMPVTIIVSSLSYHYIEAPGIRLGKKIVSLRKLSSAANP